MMENGSPNLHRHFHSTKRCDKSDESVHSLKQESCSAQEAIYAVECLQLTTSSPTGADAVQLPLEILVQIFSYISKGGGSQATLHAITLVSRSWYIAAVADLYHSPFITGKNFIKFTNTICPSINAHVRKSELAGFVRTLDLSRLVHEGSKSLTARILGRVKTGLEEFIAPQAFFAITCLPALSKCRNLRHLDLSLLFESPPIDDLFHALYQLPKLESFCFPRSSPVKKAAVAVKSKWPPTLRDVSISGGLDDKSLGFFCKAPLTLRSLTIDTASSISRICISALLLGIGNNLRILRIGFPLPKLGDGDLNPIPFSCPNLCELSIFTDHITRGFFRVAFRHLHSYPLEILTLNCSEIGAGAKIPSDAIFNAVAEGKLEHLRNVRLSKNLGWTDMEEDRENLQELREMLEALEKEEAEKTENWSTCGSAGVWII